MNAQGSAHTMLHRPRNEVTHWAGAASVGSLVLAIVQHDAGYFFPALMFLAMLLQCAQRLEVDGQVVRRVGLRPTVLDLSTAEVVQYGSSWWRELFLCGPMLMLRDDDGNRLYLESWLWDAATRLELVKSAAIY
jgi:hypothetical protein